MVKKLLFAVYLVFSLALLLYVALPNFDFPKPPSEFVQSEEPADTETSLRRAYFTDFTRGEVLDWYRGQFTKSKVINIDLPTLLMNYPPEESGIIIRDQTRSTFLQEFVHPFRETLFINGYEPAPEDGNNRIVINNVHYRQKVIVKYVPSSLILRIIIMLAALSMIPVLFSTFLYEFSRFTNLIRKNKIL